MTARGGGDGPGAPAGSDTADLGRRARAADVAADRTLLRRLVADYWLGDLAGGLGDDIADGAQAGQILVGDLHAVLVLGLHRDLHHRQRVDVQVVDERLLGGDLGRVDTGHLLDDLGETGDDLFLGGGHSDAAQ